MTQHHKRAKYIFGYHAVATAIKHTPQHVSYIYLQRNKRDGHLQDFINLANDHGIKFDFLSRERLDEMAYNANHQGVVAHITNTSNYTEEDLKSILNKTNNAPLLLILDGIQDPHNLGACLRTANAAGVDAVIAPKDKACGLTPVVYKVASGAADATPFIQVTNLARTIRMLKDFNIWIYGACEDAPQVIYDTDFTGPAALVFGAEGSGIRRLTRELCDFIVKIPMTGIVQNLNVSVAVGVGLFEVRRQRFVL